jgi:hypothetical protein
MKEQKRKPLYVDQLQLKIINLAPAESMKIILHGGVKTCHLITVFPSLTE